MPTNISSWKTKTLENLRIPLDELDQFVKGIEDNEDAELKFDRRSNFTCSTSELGEIKGKAEDDDHAAIKEFTVFGEFSGSNLDTVKSLLKKSKGSLKAILNWEGGDIEILTVKDGKVTTRPAKID